MIQGMYIFISYLQTTDLQTILLPVRISFFVKSDSWPKMTGWFCSAELQPILPVEWVDLSHFLCNTLWSPVFCEELVAVSLLQSNHGYKTKQKQSKSIKKQRGVPQKQISSWNRVFFLSYVCLVVQLRSIMWCDNPSFYSRTLRIRRIGCSIPSQHSTSLKNNIITLVITSFSIEGQF